MNTIHEKNVHQTTHPDDGLDNLLNKYKILNAGAVIIREDGNERTLILPLFNKKEVPV
jgi:hypothetical protein